MNNPNLEDWLDNPEYYFSRNGTRIKFFSIYESLKSFLLPKHDETTKGAILESIESEIERLKTSDIEDGKEKIFQLERTKWLNDHGPEHIATVIKRASQLIEPKISEFLPREIFCLLSAIQLHDIGNFYGRSGHEQNIIKVIEEGVAHIGTDQIERRQITKIAEVHGGRVKGTNDKDTISLLPKKVQLHDDEVRMRLLASILRFADEIADDSSRADTELLKKDRIPASSKIYHVYSSCLHSVKLDHNESTVELHFHIHKDYLKEKISKDDSEIYLIDEIYNRALKMHDERIYCSRFWKPYIQIDAILVLMNFFSDDYDEQVHNEISFTLKEKGYPTNSLSIYQMCPDLVIDGKPINGEYFKSHILKNEKK